MRLNISVRFSSSTNIINKKEVQMLKSAPCVFVIELAVMLILAVHNALTDTSYI